jgi:hypothetical protein
MADSKLKTAVSNRLFEINYRLRAKKKAALTNLED